MISMSKFHDGGFVLHNIPGRSGGSRISAWYSADGKCIDAELFTGLTRSSGRSVKVGGPTWDTLNMWGKIALHGAGRDSRIAIHT